MSRKNVLLHAMLNVIAEMGGSHLTREARARTAHKFAEFVFDSGYTHVLNVAAVCGKQLREYVAMRRITTSNVRTLQNEVAHVRKILRFGGRGAVASAVELSNKSLGISGGSRTGKKTAMTYDEYCHARDTAIAKGRPGIAAMLRLEWVLGLRGNEAIHARQDVLARWEREVPSGRVRVNEGTKGGRSRDVEVLDLKAAREAIQEAKEIAHAQGGFLIVRANGNPAGGLKEARSIYHSWAHRQRIVPHRARYTFAQHQVDEYQRRGLSRREALREASNAMGHGDGRGRWVKSVYGQRPDGGGA